MPYQPITAFLEKLLPEGSPQENPPPALPEIPPKDFDTWNEKKKTLENSAQEIVYKAGQIWWCSLGLNIGSEQDGKHENFERPVLIIRSLGKKICLCVPLTTSDERHFFKIPVPSFSPETKASISQVRTISTKRLLRRIDTLERKEFAMVKQALHSLIG